MSGQENHYGSGSGSGEGSHTDFDMNSGSGDSGSGSIDGSSGDGDDNTDRTSGYVATTASSNSVDNGITTPVLTITARSFVVNLDCQEWLAHNATHPPCNTISWAISRPICEVQTLDDWSILKRAVRTSGAKVIHQLPNLNEL